ncbi:MAG: uL14 family ribosomal protein [archaeon]|nr:MAG: uL14 family ribosomal protein [archaeon]
MKALKARIIKSLNLGATVDVADNSGAKKARIIAVKKGKSRKGRQIACGVGALVKVSVKEGNKDVRKQVFWAVVVRQKKPYRRLTGERICFESNAVVLLKDTAGNPKGTQTKGPVAREVTDRWPFIAKIAGVIV